MTPPLGGAISSIAYAALSKNFFYYKAADPYAHAQNETGRMGEVVDGDSRDNSAGEGIRRARTDETNPVASWFNTETPSLRFEEPSSAQGVGSIIR